VTKSRFYVTFVTFAKTWSARDASRNKVKLT